MFIQRRDFFEYLGCNPPAGSGGNLTYPAIGFKVENTPDDDKQHIIASDAVGMCIDIMERNGEISVTWMQWGVIDPKNEPMSPPPSTTLKLSGFQKNGITKKDDLPEILFSLKARVSDGVQLQITSCEIKNPEIPHAPRVNALKQYVHNLEESLKELGVIRKKLRKTLQMDLEAFEAFYEKMTESKFGMGMMGGRRGSNGRQFKNTTGQAKPSRPGSGAF